MSDVASLNPPDDWLAVELAQGRGVSRKDLRWLRLFSAWLQAAISAGVELKNWFDDLELAPTTGSGTALRPKGIAVGNVPGDKLQDWLVGRDVTIDERHYDYAGFRRTGAGAAPRPAPCSPCTQRSRSP
jgi:hypothetical protein